jgi:hypothetical protein
MLHMRKAEVPQAILNCYPEYTGQKFRLIETERYSMSNYWDEGSRSYFKLVNLGTGEFITPTAQTSNPFLNISHASFEIPNNHAVVEHAIISGKDAGLFIYVNKSNISKLLPTTTPITLTDDEKACLEATRKYKSSYGGVSRRQQIGMPSFRWETAKQGLIEKKLLKKNGALTIEGKNYAGTMSL